MIGMEILQPVVALAAWTMVMWAWMYGYSPPSRDSDPGDIRNYFELEKEKVSVVRDKILSSIENAESLMQTIDHDEE